MSVYRFLTTNILTGQVMGDWLPMTPQNFARNINATGTFTGALNLAAGQPAENRNWVAAVENEKSVLWVFQDQQPVWVGIIWDWPHMSVLDNTLPITASTPESLFAHRQISDTLTFTNADIFDVFRSLAVYALAKTPNGQLAGFTMGTNKAGVTTSVTYNSTDLKLISDAWTDLISAYDFEYSIRPGIDPSGNLFMSLDLGYPTLGLGLDAAGLAFNLPGNLQDYRFTRTGSSSSNLVVATASASGTLAALNANTGFESGVSPWTGVNGAAGTLAQSSAWSNSGSFSLSFHGNGSSSGPSAQTESIPVTAGTSYSFSATLDSAQGWSEVLLIINWYDDTDTLIEFDGGDPVEVDISTPVSASFVAMAPAGAVSAVAQIELGGTPASSVLMLVDDAVFAPSAPASGNWQSQPPHGLDQDALSAGYPLLESSTSLSTVTVEEQSQIDAFADGVVAPLAGTQLAPMLTLSGGQQPAVKDIVLGSWCYFNGTSPLHPANADGSPGLQVTGRVVGWTLYPPSASQSEYTWIQLGEISDIDGTAYVPFTGASGVTA